MYMKKHGLHLSKEEFLIKYKNFDDMYEITSPWTNSQEKHIIRCKKCNHKWNVRLYNVATGLCGCPFCTDHHTKWDTLFVSQLLEDNEFELLSECNCKNDDVLVRHKKCGTVFTNKPKNFIRKCEGLWLISCPNCRNNSHGEYIINEILTKYNINFKREYVFKDLKGSRGGYLRFDFAILDSENNPIYLIEYDGKQHFEDTGWDVYDRNYHERCKLHDKLKNNYCKEHDIELFRINYNKRRTIDKIIINFLKEHKLIPSQAS